MTHRRKLLQNIGIGRRSGLGFLEDWKLQLFEQDAGKLARRVEVYFHPSDSRNLLVQAP